MKKNVINLIKPDIKKISNQMVSDKIHQHFKRHLFKQSYRILITLRELLQILFVVFKIKKRQNDIGRKVFIIAKLIINVKKHWMAVTGSIPFKHQNLIRYSFTSILGNSHSYMEPRAFPILKAFLQDSDESNTLQSRIARRGITIHKAALCITRGFRRNM